MKKNLVKKKQYRGWPVFTPVDVNVTCAICFDSWVNHGPLANHCPPCGANIYARNRKTGWQTKVVDNCNKIWGHKGPCGVVKTKAARPATKKSAR